MRQLTIPATVVAHLKSAKMKTFAIASILILASSQIFGQLQINAGIDTTICTSPWDIDTIHIGGKPTASGGVQPYTYAWSTNYTIGSYSFGASYFLDDTTIANPRLIDGVDDKLKFKLTVRDNIGTQLEDSVNIRFSRFVYLLIDNFAYINQGDTITLWNNIWGGILPLSFSWSPNYNISDTSVSEPLAWPDTSVNYTMIAIDSIGCISAPDVFEVYVNPVGINTSIESDFRSVIIPNPITNNSILLINKPFQDKIIIKVYNLNGQLILSDNFATKSYKIGEKINNNGLYSYVLIRGSEILISGQFVKK
jgi:hypothetical protein